MNKTELRKIANENKITGFAHYRNWLRAIYEQLKAVDNSYSFAKMSTDLGFGSSNAHLIINGKRELTEKTANYVVDSLKLGGKDKKYLLALIRYERAKTGADRDKAFKELLELKTKALPNELSKSQLQFFSSWHNAAILELMRLSSSEDDPEWIAGILSPKVSVPNIKKSLDLLKNLGYLVYKNGRLIPSEATISTGDEAIGMAVSSFHQQMLDLAKLALNAVHSSRREISSVTLAIPLGMHEQIKHEIVALRKKLIAMSNQAVDHEEIVQVNFQMFSLCKDIGEKK